MFVEIGENSAREILRACGSPAMDEGKYRARRVRDGWAFTVLAGADSSSDGGLPWVVADNGQATRVLNNETEESAVAYLLSDRSS